MEGHVIKSSTEVAVELAKQLEELLQAVAEGTKGGDRRPTITIADHITDQTFERLINESEVAVKVLKQKNARAAARAKQKRRGIVRNPR